MKKTKNKEQKIVILYHKNCSDGFGAAYAAWKKFKNSAQYIGVEHQSPMLENLANKDVYLVDFSYPMEETQKLLREASSLTIIDHHISVESVVKLAPHYLYALNHSGAVLSWKYFHPNKAVPKLLRHIEDIDLWKFKISGTKEIIAALSLNDFDFKIWDKFAKEIEDSKKIKKHMETGRIIVEYREKIIERAVAQADKVNFQNYEALVVNSPILQSEIGNTLVKKGAPVGIIWSQRNGKRFFSLRANGDVDVSKLAKEFGGGGHKSAAGFSQSSEDFLPWKKIH